MPVPFEGPPTELAGLRMFLGEQRAAILRKLDGLSEEQARSHPTASEFCILTIVKHVATVERRWFQLEIARRDVPGLWPPPDDSELRVEPGDTVASIRIFYEDVIAENEAILDSVDGVDDLDSLSGIELNRRWVLLHLIEELARHAGQADIIRESIDGTKGS
jgi:hypothetical protein